MNTYTSESNINANGIMQKVDVQLRGMSGTYENVYQLYEDVKQCLLKEIQKYPSFTSEEYEAVIQYIAYRLGI